LSAARHGNVFQNDFANPLGIVFAPSFGLAIATAALRTCAACALPPPPSPSPVS
jgi:hypothetical protein